MALHRPTFTVFGPPTGPRGGGVGMVTQGIVDALSSIGPTHLVEHMSHASAMQRRVKYVRDWLGAVTKHTSLNVYTHVDLARMEGTLPRGISPPYAIFIHGWEVWWPVGGAAKRALLGAQWILSNSQTTARIARAANPWIPEIKVVLLGLNKPPPELGTWPRSKRVLMVGRLDATEQQKGYDLVLDAWPLVNRWHPDAQLVFVGAGSDLPRMQRRVEQAQLQNVIFEGFVTDERKWELLRSSSILAFPSTQEGFGLVAIEAAVVGTPVLCLRDTAVSEVLGDSGAAALPEAATAPGIARALHAVLDNPDEARVMGEKGRAWVLERYLDAHFRSRFLDALNLRSD